MEIKQKNLNDKACVLASKSPEVDWLCQQLFEKDSIINGISDPIMLLDTRNYQILEVNQAFLSSYGVSRDQVLGKTCHEITHHISEPCPEVLASDPCPLRESVRKGDLTHAEHVHKDHEGNNLYFEITSYPLKDANGDVTRLIHISRDVTDRRKAEEAVKEGAEKIKLFAYSIAHDLKSPAIGIHGLTKRLRERYGDHLDDKGREYCDQVLKASEQLSDLIEKINIFISTKEVSIHIEWVDLKEIIHTIGDEFSTQLRTRGIRWFEPDNPPRIKADRISIIRLLRNLVENALKHGGNNLTEVKVGYEDSDEFHILSVSDDGVALKRDAAERVFGLYQRDEAAGHSEGAGLGLTIVKEIAERHGGRVWIETGDERGTVFNVSIPKEPERLFFSKRKLDSLEG
jgi:PAS domain S-box-containing protein